jgi:hypothetical protein
MCKVYVDDKDLLEYVLFKCKKVVNIQRLTDSTLEEFGIYCTLRHGLVDLLEMCFWCKYRMHLGRRKEY